MDARQIKYGETAITQLEQEVRASGRPYDIVQLTRRYVEILRELVLAGEPAGQATGAE